MKILDKRGTAIGCLCALTLAGVLLGCSNFRQDPIDSNSVDNNKQIGEIQKHMTEVEYERYMKGRETLQEEKKLVAEAREERPVLDLKDDGTGTYSENIFWGKCGATVTAEFHYDKKDFSILSIDSLRMKERCGWFFVSAPSIEWDKVRFSTRKSRMAIPFQYAGSVGAGCMMCDDVIILDLEHSQKAEQQSVET